MPELGEDSFSASDSSSSASSSVLNMIHQIFVETQKSFNPLLTLRFLFFSSLLSPKTPPTNCHLLCKALTALAQRFSLYFTLVITGLYCLANGQLCNRRNMYIVDTDKRWQHLLTFVQFTLLDDTPCSTLCISDMVYLRDF